MTIVKKEEEEMEGEEAQQKRVLKSEGPDTNQHPRWSS